ncbi:MAG: stage II sporulation protein P [Desulfitobacteriaceae bacterium]|nr:stage II sporulation protein P [Desulfitobacteriaceae bacterium]
MAWKIQVYRRRDYLWRKAPAFVLLLLLIIGFYLGIKLNGLVVPVSRMIIGADVSAERRIVGAFYQVLPVASYNGLNYVEDEATGLLLTAMEDMTNVDLADPASFFETQLAHFNSAQPVTAEPEVFPSGGEEFSLPEKVDEASPLDETKPLVAIYCTHNAECYTPSQGQEKIEGKNGGIYSAAKHLKETLETKHQTAAILSSTIHDYPDWAKSYPNSLVTLEQLKKNYPSVKMFIDLHRDALTPKKSTTFEINGKKAARLLLIVGSDTRLPHPNWRQNRQLANYVADLAEERYPGFIKGVRVQDGRYNQHVSPRCLLVEVGGTENTLEEAKLAMEMLADVISLVVKESEEE